MAGEWIISRGRNWKTSFSNLLGGARKRLSAPGARRNSICRRQARARPEWSSTNSLNRVQSHLSDFRRAGRASCGRPSRARVECLPRRRSKQVRGHFWTSFPTPIPSVRAGWDHFKSTALCLRRRPTSGPHQNDDNGRHLSGRLFFATSARPETLQCNLFNVPPIVLARPPGRGATSGATTSRPEDASGGLNKQIEPSRWLNMSSPESDWPNEAPSDGGAPN